MDKTYDHKELYALGYHRLVPIIPPDAAISATSSFFARVGTAQDYRGKAVGVRGFDGLWRGYDWVKYENDESDVTRWADMGSGCGIKTGEGLIAIDADTMDKDSAKIIRDLVKEHLGQLPVRVGRYPKALYLCRVSEPYNYTRVMFGPLDNAGKPSERVEVLSDGRQFVAYGDHPKTMKPYAWPRGLIAYDELPVFTKAQIDTLLKDLSAALPHSEAPLSSGGAEEVSQAALVGGLEHIKAAVEATPNTSEVFPTREAYLSFGYAIKAALPDHPEEAFEIFSKWCERWTDGVNEHTTVESDWRRMKSPYRRGAEYIYDLAEQHSDGSFSKADVFFEVIDEAEVAKLGPRKRFNLLSIADLFNRPDPVFVIDRHLPEHSMGFLYGAPGTGKSFLALDWALHMAFGRPSWNGDAVSPAKGFVVYLAGEGASGFKTRVRAWLTKNEVAEAERGRFVLLPQAVDFMSVEEVKALASTLKEELGGAVSMIVVDTVSRAVPGADENTQKEMTLFVKACDYLRDSFSCVVLGVHHAGKSGDMRGSTVLSGAGDFVFKLDRKKGAKVGHLVCEKQKDAPDGWSDAYRFDVVNVDEEHSSLVPVRCDKTLGGVELTVTAELTREILAAMDKAFKEGKPWGKTYHAKERYAVKVMAQEFGVGAEKASELLDLWEATGSISLELVDKNTKLKGYKVLNALATTPDVFE